MNKIQNIIFMGTPEFAVPSLQSLIDKNYTPSLIITQPDKRRGRGRKFSPSPVKKIGLKNNISIYQPQNINGNDTIEKIKTLAPELIIVVAYGKFIGTTIRNIPKHKCINLHPSLLPKYRGPSPINFTLFRGEKITGNSIIYVAKKMDSGDILYQSEIKISSRDNYGSLKSKLSQQAANDILNCIHLIERQQIKSESQNESKVIFSKLIDNSIRNICWKDSAQDINNKIRGLAPHPAAFTYLDGRKMKILESEIWSEKKNSHPGMIFSVIKGKGFLVGTGNKPLLVKTIKPAGKQKMSAFSFSLGNKVENKKLGNAKK